MAVAVDALQVLSEPRRREILRLVWTDELSAGDIASHFNVTFGAISQHLGILRDAGFVQTRRDGNRRIYLADRAQLGPLAQVLEGMWTEALDRLATAVEEEKGVAGRV